MLEQSNEKRGDAMGFTSEGYLISLSYHTFDYFILCGCYCLLIFALFCLYSKLSISFSNIFAFDYFSGSFILEWSFESLQFLLYFVSIKDYC